MKTIILLLFLALSGGAAGRAQTAPSAGSAIDAAQPASTLSGHAAPSEYVIGSADVLDVTVWKEPGISGTYLVRPDGMISLPLLGDLKAAGATPPVLSENIAELLKKFIQNPNVTVVVTQVHSKVIYLLGEVQKKGPVDMTPGMTVLEAIGNAGGFTDFANTRKIYILRDENGQRQRIPVHYKAALKGNRDQDLALKAGDTIVVP